MCERVMASKQVTRFAPASTKNKVSVLVTNKAAVMIVMTEMKVIAVFVATWERRLRILLNYAE